MDSDSQRMVVDADVRRLTLSKLADYLESQQPTATDQWLMAVRRDPEIATADRLTHQQLIDHLPEIYQECCAFLRTRDATVLVEGAKSDAKTHGEIRWTDGYRIEELIRELEVFRGIFGGIVLRFGDIDPRFHGPIVAAAVSLVQQFFGEITVHSVAQYSGEQQRVVHTYTGQLEAANLELSRANVNLEQALSERQRLIAVLAHEVRTFLQGMKRAGETSAEAERKIADTQFKDVEQLLGQLLDHTTLIANREPPVTVAFDPSELHEELLMIYRPIANQSGLALIGSSADAPRMVKGDRLRVKQIASNLLSNALKFTGQGHVAVTFAARGPDQWVMQIADTGPGLDEAAAQLLFDAGPASAEVIPRRGIGLAITKDLVGMLNGTIQVITKAGGGSVFEIVLPCNLA